MSRKTLLLTASLVLLLCVALACATDTAYAQGNINADKDMASKKGVAESLGTKEFDKEKLPGKLKIGFAFGSVAAAVAAFKWL